MTDRSLTIGKRKKVLYAGIVLLLSLLLVEVGIRVLFAFQVGPRVLLYGTSYFRILAVAPGQGGVQLPGTINPHRRGDHSAVGNTDHEIGTKAGGYAKYFPNESKIDFDANGNKFKVLINDKGFRGENFSSQKERGVVRVITLGASSTFGYYDRDNETYPFYLEQELILSGGGTKFEVLNFGIPHLTSDQILQMFEAEALALNPDVVTFYEGINDSSEMPEEIWKAKQEGQTADSRFRTLRRALGNLSLIRNAYAAVRDRLITLALIDSMLVADVITYNRQDLERHITGKSARFLVNVSALRETCRRRGIVFVVLTQQARSMTVADIKGLTYENEIRQIQDKLNTTNKITHQDKTFLTHKIIMDDLKSWARSEGVPIVDVIDLLDRDRDVLLSWVHLSPRGNQLIATALSQEILRTIRHADRKTIP